MENSKYHPPKYTESLTPLVDLLEVRNIDINTIFEKADP